MSHFALGTTRDAFAEIQGRVRSAGRQLTVPFTTEPTLAYVARFERRRLGVRTYAATIVRGVDFLVEASRGPCRVVFTIDTRVYVETTTLDLRPDRRHVERFLLAHGESELHAPGARFVNIGLVDEGDTIAVAGMGRWREATQTATDHAYRDTSHEFVMRSHPGTPLVIRSLRC